MRALAMAVLVVGAASLAGPARAQTYDPGYPVCLKQVGRVSFIECRYSSLEQCAVAASGRAAQCLINPYPAKAYASSARRNKPQRRVY